MILSFFYVYDQLLVYRRLIYIHLHSHRLLKAILALSHLLLSLLLSGAVYRFFPLFSSVGVRIPFVFQRPGVDLYSTSRYKMRQTIF